MSMAGDFHIAQVNVATPLAPLESPRLAEFVAALEPINALADASPGFVWRLQTDDGDATSIRAFADDRILINMSVWESIEALEDFVYRSAHTAVMRRRAAWFERSAEAYLALWWIPAGELPTAADAEPRLTSLREHGPTPFAFTLQRRFPAPERRLSH
jgi:hypothetical protein